MSKKKEEKEKASMSSWEVLKRTSKYFKNAKKFLFGYAFVSIVEAIVSIFTPIASAKVILNLTDGIFNQLILSAVVLLFLDSIRATASFFKSNFYREIYIATINGIKIDLSKSILSLEVSELDNTSSGIFVDRINKDTEDISGVFMEISYWITYIITNIGVLVAIFILNKYIFIYSVLVSLLFLFFNQRKINKYYKTQKKVKELNESVTSITTEFVRGIKDIKVLNASSSVLDTVKSRIKDVSYEKNKAITIRNVYSFITTGLIYLTNFIFIAFGCYLAQNNLLAIPSFLILYNYQGRVRNLFDGIANLTEYFKSYQLSGSRIFEIISGKKYKVEKFGNKNIDKIVGNVEFKNVFFSYNAGEQVLKGINFKIKENTTVAFVGKSGAGKTTIFSLMAALYKPNKGNIYLDGIDIKKLNEASIRDNVAIITQNPYIFNFSIKDNLLLTSPNATDEEIVEACKIAALDDFIKSLPDKYDTIVGEGGVTLSGGQRQRLAIARALLMKTKIILFDEATSALDNETQNEIQTAIKNMKGEYTIVIVAHRLSTIIDADKILVIDDGKVVESGTYKSLMKDSKIYKNLYKRESK